MTAIEVHACAAIIAVACGAVVLVAAKGTTFHRWAGRTYVAVLAVMVLTSFWIYELRTGPSVFHGVSILLIALTGYGVTQVAFRRRRDWQRRHAAAMQATVLVLIVTGTAQFFDRLPLPHDALNAIVFLQVPLIIGIVAIVRSSRKAVQPE